MHSLRASYLFRDASDAADNEGKCLKAEVEILRSHARRNVSALAQLAAGTDCSLQPSPASQTLHCLQRSRHGDVLSTANQPGQNQRLLHCSHHATQAELQQQRQSACSTSGGVALGQQQAQQGSESASEQELAAVEEGLSALEHQITSAALRCLVSVSVPVHLIPCMQYGADLAWLSGKLS